MNGLQDPIAGKGYANILPALKVPEFGEIASMQTANNQLALNAAKLAADQKAKADALAAAKVKAEKEAQDAAKKAEAKKQADAWTLIAPENSPLIGDAPKWAAEAYDKMVKEAQGLMAQGIDLNSFDPKAVAFRSGTLQNYRVNYKRHSEVAKALAEKQKQWSTKPDDYESYSLADELGSKYNVTGWDKDYYTPSLLPKVGVATPAEIAAYEKQMFGESKYKKDMSGKPVGRTRDGDDVYLKTESYESRPFEQTAEDVNKNLRYSTDTKQKQLYNFYHNQAKAQGLVDENDNILPQYFQKREEVTREKGGIEDVVQQVQKVKESGGGNNYSFGWNGNQMVLGNGKKQHTISFNPNGADINAGNITKLKKMPKGTADEGDVYYQSVGSTSVDGGALAGDKMLENTAWAIGKGTKPQPFTGDVGTINTDQLLIFPVNTQGVPIGAIRNSKRHADSPRTGHERYNLFAKVVTPKVGDVGGETVLVNLHNAFPAEMEQRGMRTVFNDEEAKRWTGEGETPVQQPQNKTTPKTQAIDTETNLDD